MQARSIYASLLIYLIPLGGVAVHAVDIIEDFSQVDSNMDIAATGQTSSPGLIKHPLSIYAWGGWNNAPAESGNTQLRYVSSGEVQYRGDASLAGTYLISRFDVSCDLDVIEFHKTRSASRKTSFLVRDAATQNWYITDPLEQAVGNARYNVTELNWWPVVDGNAELNGDTFVPLSFGGQTAWPDITIDGAGVHCDGDGSGPLEWNKLMLLEAGSNQPPVVEAGPDREVTLPDGGQIALAGTASDDGNPIPPGQLTITWSVLSQPEGANVTFTPSANVLDPNATFDQAGQYELQLTADDGLLQASDSLMVTVLAKKLETVSLLPLDDTFIRANRETNTHGDSTDLRARNDGSWTSYLKFNIWQVPGNPVRIKLKLYAKDNMPNARVWAAQYGPSGEWFEDTLSWATSDIVNGAVLATIDSVVKGEFYEFNVTDLLVESDGRATLGLTSSSTGNTDFSSKEDATPQRPELIVAYDSRQAHHPLPVNGAAEVHPGAVLSWIAAEGSTQDRIFVGTDPNNLELAATLTVTNDPINGELFDPPSELEIGQTYYWQIVTSAGVAGPVWTFTVMETHPDLPISLTPVDGGTDLRVPEDVAFRYATTPDAAPEGYNLYISSDRALVENLDPTVVIPDVHVDYSDADGIDVRQFVDFLPLTTYYYRFEGTSAGGSWPNAIQSFTTTFFVNLDGENDPASGIAWSANRGATTSPADVAHRGVSSLRLDYNGESSAIATFNRPRDFADPNVDGLTLFMRGMAANAEASLAVTLTDAAGTESTVAATVDVTDEDPWQAVDLDIADFAVDLSQVTQLTVTVTSSGTGILYIDDLCLYAPVDENGLLGFLVRYPFEVDGRDAGPQGLDLELRSKGTGSYEIHPDAAVGAGAFRIHGSGENFENGAYGQRPGDDNLDIKAAVTVSLWMKEDGTQADNPWAGLFGEGLDNPSYMRKQAFQVLRASNSRVRWKCNRNNDPNATSPEGADNLFYTNGFSGPDTRDGQWHHIAATYDSELGHTLYVDGLKRLFLATTGLIDDPADGAGIMVGAKDHEEIDSQLTGDPTHFFFGWLDEIVCYDRALSGAEIDLIYRRGVVVEGDANGNGMLDD